MNSFTTVIYTFKVSKHIIIGQSTNINVFTWLLFFFKLRERESGIQNLGIKEKRPQSNLSYFSMVFHWRIFLLSRANRLYSIFSLWLEEPGVPRVSGILLSSTRNTGYGSSARYEPCSKTAFLIIYFAKGKECPLRFGVPANHLASLFSPLVSGDLRLLSTNIWSPLCDPHSFLTVTLWRLDTVNSNTRSSNFISLLPVGYRVTLYCVVNTLV